MHIFVTIRPYLVEACDTIDGTSNHEAVLITSTVIANLSHPSKRIIYLWAQADLNIIHSNLQTLCDDFLNTSTAVDIF